MYDIHVVRASWTSPDIFQKQRQEFILWTFLEMGHWQKTSCSVIFEECEVECYRMSHPAVGCLLYF